MYNQDLKKRNVTALWIVWTRYRYSKRDEVNLRDAPVFVSCSVKSNIEERSKNYESVDGI